jgi:two-component system cell cycle sensor histidine kinase/response regulator CckA
MKRQLAQYGWLPRLILLMTVVAVIIGILALYYVQTRLLTRAGEALQLSAVEIAEKLDRLLYERYGDVEVMSQALSRISDNPSRTAYLSWMKRFYPVYLWLAVTDETGRIVVATDPKTIGLNVSRRAWFQAARQKNDVVISDVQPFETLGGVDAVAFSAPIMGPHGFQGVVTTRVGLPALEELVVRSIRVLQAAQRVAASVEYQFVKRDGTAFIDSIVKDRDLNFRTLRLPSFLRSDETESGYLEEEHLRRDVTVVTGYARTQGYHEFPGFQWTILVRMDRTDVLRPVRDVLWRLGGAAAIVWLPMLLLLYWSTARLQGQYRHSLQQERRRSAQYAVTRVLSESVTLAEVAPKILESICLSLDWKVGLVWTVDSMSEELRCLDVYRREPQCYEHFERASRDRTFRPGIGLPGRVWSSGEPAWIVDVVKDDNFPRADVAAQDRLHAAVGFPIVHAGAVRGILEFFSDDLRTPDQDLLDMMGAIGTQIGQFMDRKHLEQQVLQADKMKALGGLAGGVAHDFNNLLTIIGGYTQTLLSSIRDNDVYREQLQQIQMATERAADLTKQLLAFSRQQVLEAKIFSVPSVIHAVEALLRPLIGEDIQLVANVSSDTGFVKADPGQLQQVLLNLLVNARDAMPTGGHIRIEADNVEYSQAAPKGPDTIPAGRYVRVRISDTGCGMSPSVRTRIFDPFFTTKAHGKGTGRGLSRVYGIVQQSGGHISVYSEVGQGTTVTLYLPRVEGAPTPLGEALREAALITGHETILLVEDEPSVRGLAAETLRAHGYQVIEARDGIDAMVKATAVLAKIALMVTDVVMPQMSGPELANQLRVLKPELAVLYMSGFTDDAMVRYGVERERMAYLQKPFSPNILLRKVRAVLDMPKQPQADVA